MRALAAAVAAVLAVALAAALGSLGPGAAGAEAAPWSYAQSMSQRRRYLAAAELGGGLRLSNDVYGVRGFELREENDQLDLQSNFSPEDDVTFGVGDRLGLSWGPASGWTRALDRVSASGSDRVSAGGRPTPSRGVVGVGGGLG